LILDVLFYPERMPEEVLTLLEMVK